MTDVPATTKAPDVKIVQGRSPAYPFIPLEKAVERADQVRAANAARQPMTPETFYKIWGLGSGSSGSRQTMAALNHFGLADYMARGSDRKVKLSDTALRIVFDKQPISPERDAALKEAALTPSIHRDMWEKYGPILPADFVIETYLVRDRGYNEGAAKSLIGEYKATLRFAGLDQPDSMPPASTGDEGLSPPPSNPEVGDLVQVTVNGADQFAEPVKVREIREHHGQTWVLTEGGNAWVLMEQVTVQSKGSGSGAPTPPPMPFDEPAKPAQPKAGTQRDAFSLEEGVVSIEFPDKLTADSVEELAEFFALFIKKAKRRASTQ